jgi:hypothetical protein
MNGERIEADFGHDWISVFRTASVRLRSLLLLLFPGSVRSRLLLLRLLCRQVVPDRASRDRAHDGMVAGIMPGDAADNRTFDAALGFRRCGGR